MQKEDNYNCPQSAFDMKAKAKNKKKDEELNKKLLLGDDYKPIERLGNGTYGTVYKVKKLSSGEIFAVKKFNMEKETDGIPSTALREIAILKQLNHPNIVSVKDLAFGEKSIELCLEYCSFDLKKLMDHLLKNDRKNYNLSFIQNMMYQILQGVEYLHCNKIFHRDLKPQNILVTDSYIAKLADFGLSRVYSIPLRPYTKEILTLWYRAPEMLLGTNTYSIGLDMWSLGCIFVELFCGKPFVTGDSEIDQLFKLFQIFGTFNDVILPGYKNYPFFSEEFPFWHPLGLRNYLLERTVVKMDERALDLAEKMLRVDPCKRISCREALKHKFFEGVNVGIDYDKE